VNQVLARAQKAVAVSLRSSASSSEYVSREYPSIAVSGSDGRGRVSTSVSTAHLARTGAYVDLSDQFACAYCESAEPPPRLSAT
jgi:hypothetical protein